MTQPALGLTTALPPVVSLFWFWFLNCLWMEMKCLDRVGVGVGVGDEHVSFC